MRYIDTTTINIDTCADTDSYLLVNRGTQLRNHCTESVRCQLIAKLSETRENHVVKVHWAYNVLQMAAMKRVRKLFYTEVRLQLLSYLVHFELPRKLHRSSVLTGWYMLPLTPRCSCTAEKLEPSISQRLSKVFLQPTRQDLFIIMYSTGLTVLHILI